MRNSTKQPALFKIVSPSGAAQNGGHGLWNLPRGSKPGKWMAPIKGGLKPCKKGYHLCHFEDVNHWLKESSVIHLAEYKGEIIHANLKSVVARARLVREIKLSPAAADKCMQKIIRHFIARVRSKRERARLESILSNKINAGRRIARMRLVTNNSECLNAYYIMGYWANQYGTALMRLSSFVAFAKRNASRKELPWLDRVVSKTLGVDSIFKLDTL